MHINEKEIQALKESVKSKSEASTKRGRTPSIKVGEIYKTQMHGFCEVVEYISALEVKVTFLETGYTTTVQVGHLREGKVKDRLAPSVCNVGIVGDAATVDQYGQVLESYQSWQQAIYRTKHRKEYAGVSLDSEFCYYPKFKTWYENLAQPLLESGFDITIEKDLLAWTQDKPPAYSFEQCFLCPKSLNSNIVHLQKQLKEIKDSPEDALVTGISGLGNNRSGYRVFLKDEGRDKVFATFGKESLAQAKILLRKIRIIQFQRKASPFLHTLPEHVQMVILNLEDYPI